MKKLLSTIGLGIALMTGFAPSQALASITLINTATGPNTWTYDLQVTDQVISVSDYIVLTTTGAMTGVGGPAPVGLEVWDAYLFDAYNARWTLGNTGIDARGTTITIKDFWVTSTADNGPVTWSYNGGTPSDISGPVPEPATVMLLGIGGLLAGGRKFYESRKDAVMA